MKALVWKFYILYDSHGRPKIWLHVSGHETNLLQIKIEILRLKHKPYIGLKAVFLRCGLGARKSR